MPTIYKLPEFFVNMLAESSRQPHGLTADRRLLAARMLRDYAVQCREQGNHDDASFAEWVAGNYAAG